MLTLEKTLTEDLQGSTPYIELSFAVVGDVLPADHGYGLYSAIAHKCADIHGLEGLSIQTIAGKPDQQGKIFLSHRSRLKLRLPYSPSHLGLLLPLAGQQLTIGQHTIQLGIPQLYPLRPTNKLRSRIVTIKNFEEPEPFLAAAKRQLEALGIQGNLFIPLNEKGEPSRKAIKIKSYSVVGFSLIATDLRDEDSIKLQMFGLGGKHRMGCGVFTLFPHAWRFSDA
ncbi:type I-MYXAN CRISPR-associated protein Cas6/Cmx6 [Thermosynechococcus sp. FA-CM-4201]